jgi:hypothetical protein
VCVGRPSPTRRDHLGLTPTARALSLRWPIADIPLLRSQSSAIPSSQGWCKCQRSTFVWRLVPMRATAGAAAHAQGLPTPRTQVWPMSLSRPVSCLEE